MIEELKDVYRNIRFSCRDILYNRKNRAKLKNRDFSIICSDCTAGCICKDLRVQMKSPTRNLFFMADDFIKFCSNLKYYLSLSLTEDDDTDKTEYLTAKCGDLRLYLVHYGSFDQACEEWERRKNRVNFDNLFILMNDRNDCSVENLKDFDQLPYKNKICFTHKKYRSINPHIICPGVITKTV